MPENTQESALYVTATLRCANHPGRETLLRCNRCEKPICLQCAVQTPVGYRCRECVRGQRAVYYNAEPSDLPIAAAIAIVLGGIAGGLAYAVLGNFGWFSFIAALFAGPFVGGLIAEAVRRGVGRRRGPHLKPVAAAACVLGVLLGGVLLLGGTALIAGASLSYLAGALLAVFFRLDVLLFAGLAASAIYARLV
jgi:hypothetical protein